MPDSTGPTPTPTPAEWREAIAALSAQIADVDRVSREGVEIGRENAYELRQLGGAVTQLQTAVFGSKPPPAGPALVKRQSHTEEQIDALARSDAEVVRRVETLTLAQSRAMGVPTTPDAPPWRALATFLASREGLRFMISAATAAAVFWTAAHGGKPPPIFAAPEPLPTSAPSR